MQDQDPVRRQPDHPSSDPWGLPAEPEPPAQWPEEGQPEEEPTELAPEEEESPLEEAPEESPAQPEEAEGGWSEGHAEEQARPEAVEPDDAGEPPAEEPAIRRGPLSQALAAAQSVITSLGGPPTSQTEESREEDQESAPPDTPSPHDLPDEPPPWMEAEGQTETEVVAEEEEEEEEVVLIRDAEAADLELDDSDELVRELSEREVVAEREDLVVLSEEEVSEDLHVEDVLPEAQAGDLEVDSDELVRELSETEVVAVEEEVVLLSEEETSEDLQVDEVLPEAQAGDLEVDDTDELVRELSELAEEKVVEEIEVETVAVTEEEPPEPMEPQAEEAEEDEGAGAEEEAEEEADTTPAAYAELAASLAGTEQREQEAVSSMAPAVEWGALWRESAQGWVEDDESGATWRPIVTTTPLLSDWDVDTYLGVVAGETAIGAHAGKDFTSGIRSLVGARSSSYEKDLARGRAVALRSMVDEAVARGAHAVIGVEVGHTYLGTALLVTASGTAVTLKTKP
ncbi:MAG: heavy metal-binding domain-containing protein [Acidimicrobiia bacterium]